MRTLIVVWMFTSTVAFGSSVGLAESPKTNRPNVVFLLADDLGWTGLRCFGSDFYETPNLDRFARSGMKFSNAYAACTVCSPTRASIMTGMYPARLRLTDFIAGQNRPFARMKIPDWNKGLDLDHVTLAEALKDAGYVTAMAGKWHLNHAGREPAKYGPTEHGFDFAITRPPGRGYRLKPGTNRDGESSSDYLTDYLTDRVCEFIDEHHQRPFFLYFAYHTPHTPIEGRPDLVKDFEVKQKAGLIHDNPQYAAMVASLDQSVGRVLQRLDQHQIADRTIVIFTSDNGGLTQRYGTHDGFTENLPLRRGKGSAYEGGVRVPTLIRWPGVTRPGLSCDEPVMTIDYYPTILNACGAKGDASHNAKVDGRDIQPLLNNPELNFDRDLFWHYPHYHAGVDWPYIAIRSGNYRLIESLEDGHIELYDLENDLGEQNNLAQRIPEIAKSLKSKLDRWREDLHAQMPTRNPNFDPKRATEVASRSNR